MAWSFSMVMVNGGARLVAAAVPGVGAAEVPLRERLDVLGAALAGDVGPGRARRSSGRVGRVGHGERDSGVAFDVPDLLEAATLIRMCSPSVSTQVWVSCGEPSGISGGDVAGAGCASSASSSSVRFAGRVSVTSAVSALRWGGRLSADRICRGTGRGRPVGRRARFTSGRSVAGAGTPARSRR